MIGALRRMFGAFLDTEIYRRADQGDAKFFQSQYIPLTARTIHNRDLRIVVLSQQGQVADLDADHAVVLLTTPKCRVFVSEVGTDIFTNQPNHFLVEIDPYALGPDVRLGNYGDIALGPDPVNELATAARRIVTG